ncbi:M23 family metallopeptidase [Sphingomonas sp.]|uniref:M23 family metallopeptidase n=1 Tax=Sphingomonas sp. TaxID=28214 RepID=UPI00286C108A|nr:M23 family metallopeptidase [Sphingomonas sp.]
MFRVAAAVIVTAVLTSALWIFVYNIAYAPRTNANGVVSPAGDVALVDQGSGPLVAIAEGVVVGPAGLAIPVAGVNASQLTDTFTQARAGGSRPHDAIDIMAPAGTPVLAAAAGRIEKLFFSEGGGGISAYVRSDDGRWTYYYAHLQDYAPGLAEGQHIGLGAQIGRVGSTGNASPAAPHLHFAINHMNPGEKWYQGTPINPFPLLAGKKTNG